MLQVAPDVTERHRVKTHSSNVYLCWRGENDPTYTRPRTCSLMMISQMAHVSRSCANWLWESREMGSKLHCKDLVIVFVAPRVLQRMFECGC